MASRNVRFLELISGRRKGAAFDAARFALSLLSIPYRAVISLRNTSFDWLGFRRKSVDRPVISIGNITVGGTGKTPLTVKITELLQKRGHRVAIISRGYRARGTSRPAHAMPGGERDNDETLMLRRRCPEAEVVIDSDRVRGARQAIERGVSVLMLDDGFQHRRLRRNLDIVLIDATHPFGYDRMLPRGLLREPPHALRRADLLILTRSDQISPSDRSLLLGRLQSLSQGKPVIAAVHRVTGFMDLLGNPVQVFPRDMQAIIFAGIANFQGFRQTVDELGVKVMAAYEYPDHHDYTAEEITGLQNVAVSLESNAILTTEKDAVKLVGRWTGAECRLFVLRLEIEFDAAGEKILNEALDRALKTNAPKLEGRD